MKNKLRDFNNLKIADVLYQSKKEKNLNTFEIGQKVKVIDNNHVFYIYKVDEYEVYYDKSGLQYFPWELQRV